MRNKRKERDLYKSPTKAMATKHITQRARPSCFIGGERACSCSENAVPPKTENQKRRDKLLGEYRKTERYQRAKSCKHCNDFCDSFGRYLSTYCHIKQEHIAGDISEPDKMARCFDCELYEKKESKMNQEALRRENRIK